jgi:uncharacterized protein YbjT (DUF2867 family)
MIMNDLLFRPDDRALIIGGTGFVGRKLVAELVRKRIKLRLLARNPVTAAALFSKDADVQIVRGDVVEREGLNEALRGIHTAYYLVHSLGGRSVFTNKEFARKDSRAAENFLAAAEAEGLKRIIYLGGLGEEGEGLSEHLRSRTEVGKILSSGTPLATILRSAIIIGAGGASFEMLRYLVERLPVMICPKWIDSRIQPIAIDDAVAYLAGCLFSPGTAGKTFDIGGPDVFTYREMMQEYTAARGIPRRRIVTVPLLTPLLSAYWVDLVTPVPSGIAHPLIEGLKNDVVCRNNDIDSYIPIAKTPFRTAVKAAMAEETSGPGVTGF